MEQNLPAALHYHISDRRVVANYSISSNTESEIMPSEQQKRKCKCE